MGLEVTDGPVPLRPQVQPLQRNARQHSWMASDDGAGGGPNVVVPLEVALEHSQPMQMRAALMGSAPDSMSTCQYRDPYWTLLLPLAMVVFVVFILTNRLEHNEVADIIIKVALIDLGIVLAAATIALLLACLLPQFFIRIVFIFGVLVGVFIALAAGNWLWGGVIIFSVIAFYVYSGSRIPFAVATMRMASRSLVRSPSILLLSAIGTVLVACLYMAGVFMLNGLGSMSGMLVGLAAQHYLVQVITMIAQFTSCSVTAACFYNADAFGNRTWNALRLASTTSLGSIACVSLVQSVTSIVNFVLIMIPFFGWCIRFCCTAMCGSYRTYVITYIAMYGSPVKEAAQSASQLIRTSGLNALVNDNLIDPVLNMVTFVAAIVTTVVCLPVVVPPSDGTEGGAFTVVLLSLLVAAASSFMTVMMSGVALQPIRTATATLLVCWSDDPQAVKDASRPEDYAELVNAARDRHSDLHQRFQ